MKTKLATPPQQLIEPENKKSRNYTQAFLDVLGFMGMVSLAYGLYSIYPPAMFVVIGILTTVIALILSR